MIPSRSPWPATLGASLALALMSGACGDGGAGGGPSTGAPATAALPYSTAGAMPAGGMPPGHPPMGSGLPAGDPHAGMGMGDVGAAAGTPALLAWTAPEGWAARPPASRMRLAEFTLPRAEGDPEDGVLAIYVPVRRITFSRPEC